MSQLNFAGASADPLLVNGGILSVTPNFLQFKHTIFWVQVHNYTKTKLGKIVTSKQPSSCWRNLE